MHAPDEAADMPRELAVLFAWPDRAEPLRILSGLPSPEARDAVRRETVRLYARQPEHPVEIEACVRQLRAAAHDDPSRAAMPSRLLLAMERRPGPEPELLELVDWLDFSQSRLGVRDRITLASYLVDKQDPDRVPLIGPPPGDRAGAAAGAPVARGRRDRVVRDDAQDDVRGRVLDDVLDH